MSRIVVENVEIVKNKNLGHGYHVITMAPFSKIRTIRPGQFVHMKVPKCSVYFRRAFSIYDINRENKSFEIIFKVLGRGTSVMSVLKKGDVIDVLGPLGNGFTLPKRTESVILVAGGIGMPPVYFLARHLVGKNYDPRKLIFFYGGRSKGDLVEISRIKKLGIKVVPVTEDGSYGYKGLVTRAIEDRFSENGNRCTIYACGPEGMLGAIEDLAVRYKIGGQLSMEAPMPCGIGVCLGCIKLLKAGGYTRVCRDGPVYDVGEVIL